MGSEYKRKGVAGKSSTLKWRGTFVQKRKNQKSILVLCIMLGFVSCFAGFYRNPAYSSAAGTAADVLAVAASQIGYHEKASEDNLDDFLANTCTDDTANYTKYARDLGMPNGQSWCGYFVWWCMRSAGVTEDRYPSIGNVTSTKDWFVARGLWHDRGTYTPSPGDYIAFYNPLSHCGIVESVSADRVYTIEGNSSDMVKRKDYALTDTHVAGYGTICYSGIAPTAAPPVATQAPAATKAPVIPSADTSNPGSPYPIPDEILGSGSKGDPVKWIQTCLNELLNAGITVDGIYGSQTVSAVKTFQKKNGLTADGVVGTNTINKMLELWRQKSLGSVGQTGKGNAQVKVPTVAKVSKFRATAKKKGFVLHWKKNTSVSGYQIQLSRKKNFKQAKSYHCNVKGKDTVSGLKSKKNYYIRIRAYKTYQTSKGKTKKVYGKYVTIQKKTK